MLLALGVLAVAAVRSWLATRVPMPWLFSDELIHSELAKDLAHGQLFEIRGEHVNVTYAYPLVISPAWILHPLSSTYYTAKLINIALVSVASVPIYLWAKRLMSSLAAATVSILALFLPDLTLSSALMQENLAYPAFLFAAFMLALVLEAPTWTRQLLLLAAAVVAATARFELAILFAIIPIAIVLARAPARRMLGVLIPTVGVVVALVTLLAARHSTLQQALQTFPQTSASYSIGGFAKWLTWTVGGLAMAIGIVPLLAFVILSDQESSEQGIAERAFLAISWASLLSFLMLAGVSGAWNPYGLKERYVVYVEPLLLIGLFLWASSTAPRRLIVGMLGSLGLVLAIASLPLGSLLRAGSLPGNALGLELFVNLGDRFGFGNGLTILVIVLSGAISVITAAATRRNLKLAIAVSVGLFLVVSSGFAARAIERQARAVARTTSLPANRSWIDSIAGEQAGVTLLNTSIFMPETVVGDYWTIWAPWWETEFWNRSAKRVYGLGAPEPLGLSQSSGSLDWASGRIAAKPPSNWILVDPRFEVFGRRRAASSTFVLYDHIALPFRLVSAEEGVFRDGRSATEAAYDRWQGSANPKRVEIELERDQPPGNARPTIQIDVGTLTEEGATPLIGHELHRRRLSIGRMRMIAIPVPPPPFRIEVRWLTGSPGKIRFHSIGPQVRTRIAST